MWSLLSVRPSFSLLRVRPQSYGATRLGEFLSRAMSYLRKAWVRLGDRTRTDIVLAGPQFEAALGQFHVRGPSPVLESDSMVITANTECDLRPKVAPDVIVVLTKGDVRLASDLDGLLGELSQEFHKELLDLLSWFSTEELKRFVELWTCVEPRMRVAFIAFVTAGGVPDGDFLAYLNREVDCQEAVDLAFVAHIRSLNDFSQALSRAGEVRNASADAAERPL
jgi:hypothetical protein